MAEDRDARVEAQHLVNALADLGAASGAFSDDDHEMRVAGKSGLTDAVDDVALKVHALFGDEHGRCAGRKADIERQMARVMAHDLDDGAAFMRLHRIAQAVDGFDSRIGRRVVANGVFGADDVVVDGRRDARHGNALLAQLDKAPEGAVAADTDDAVQTQQLAGRGRLLLALQRAEFLAAGGVEHRAAAIDDMRNAVCRQLDKVTVNQAVIAAADADALDPAESGGPHDRAHSGVHARRIAAGGQDADPFDCILHNKDSFFPCYF